MGVDVDAMKACSGPSVVCICVRLHKAIASLDSENRDTDFKLLMQ